MAIQNPHAGDPVLGDAWEEGYLAGFAQPKADHLRPFAPKVLDAYLAGEQAGRDERRLLPPDEGGEQSQTVDFLIKLAEEVGLHLLGHKFFHDLFGKVGGVIPLVITVMQVSTDTPIQPLKDDWTGPVDQPNDVYIAVCPRDDHGPMVGATKQGYWTGSSQKSFAQALSDMKKHGHDEAAVARCSVPNGECGLVWPGTGDKAIHSANTRGPYGDCPATGN